MIDIGCECGRALSYAESETGKVVTCSGCGRAILLACAEQLPPDAGSGDFDTRIEIKSSVPMPYKTVVLGGVAEITLGKSATATIPLNGQLVSRAHCKLVRTDFGPSRWKLVDTGSRNGTFVNGERISEVQLNDGDTVDAGEFELQFHLVAAPAPVPAPPVVEAGPTCPSCGKQLGARAKFCVDCGIDVKTGRSIAVSREFDENDFAVRADTWIRLVSWLVPLGLFPVASEAMGGRKPVVTWVLVALTILTSIAYFVAMGVQNEPTAQTMNMMMWTGTPESEPEENDIAQKLLQDIRDENGAAPADEVLSEEDLEELAEALSDMTPQYPPGVGFRWYQPLTAAFLHGGIMHLAGNLLFLIVFGARVNELIGNLKFAILYPVLAYASGLAYLASAGDGPAHPLLGASGAIMGLAGMYFVFYPVQRVHTAIWLRLRFWCTYKVFAIRGFWLLLLWIGFNDVLMMALSASDGVAHWAHVGGFVSGMILALGLMIARVTNAGGTDILSLVLGKKAWALIGSPTKRMHKQYPAAMPAGVPRAVSMNYPE